MRIKEFGACVLTLFLLADLSRPVGLFADDQSPLKIHSKLALRFGENTTNKPNPRLSLRMRKDDQGEPFSGQYAARKRQANVPVKPTGKPRRFARWPWKGLRFELTGSAGFDTHEISPQLGLDFNRLTDSVSVPWRGFRRDGVGFFADLALVVVVGGGAVGFSYVLSKLTGARRLGHVAEEFWAKWFVV